MRELADQAIGLRGEPAHLEQLVDARADLHADLARESQGRSRSPAATSTGMRRFSRTVSSGKISVIWNVRAMPIATRSCGGSAVMSWPSNRMRPDVGGKKPLIRLKNVVLPAPLGPMTARSSPGCDRQRYAVDGDEAAEVPRCSVLHLEQAHRRAFRRRMPSTPRGKNSTTSTKNRPMNDIQFSVWLDT